MTKPLCRRPGCGSSDKDHVAELTHMPPDIYASGARLRASAEPIGYPARISFAETLTLPGDSCV